MLTPILASAQSDDVEFTGLEIAEKTISFLESLRHEDGNYTWASPCKYDYCTRSGIPLQQNPAWLALAYSGLYEATGEQRYLDKVKAHMTDLRTDCPPDNFSCVFVGVQAEKAYQLTEDESYLDYLRLISRQYSQGHPTFMIRAIGARELSLKSKHIGLNRVLDIQEELRLMDTSLLEQPEAVPGTGLKRGACWLSLAWLEYLSLPVEKMVPPEWVKDPPLGYQAISDYWHGYYEKSAYEFHRANNFSALFDGGNPDVYALPLTEVVPCIESLQLMYERTGEERYLRELDVLEEYVLQNHWDTPDNRKFNGDYGFLVQGCVETSRGESCYFNTKLLNDNAYLAYLFSKNKDKVYTLKKKPAAVYYPEPVQDPNYPQKRAEEPKPPQAPAKRGAPKAYVAYALAFIAAAAALAHVLRSRSVRAPKSRSNPKTERGGKG